jgi:hypothetical protein
VYENIINNGTSNDLTTGQSNGLVNQNLVDLGEHEQRSATIELGQHGRIPSS